MKPDDRKLLTGLGVTTGVLGLIAVVGLVIGLVTSCRTHAPAPDPTTADRIHVMIGGRTFDLELALTPEKRQRGLMFRQMLAEDGGMLFVFPDSAVRQFWMKNCLIDLDILFLDESGRIVSVKTMTAPPPEARSYPHWSSDGPARFAVELNAGTADKLGVGAGQIVELPLETLKRRAR